jgi:hypothetical protein
MIEYIFISYVVMLLWCLKWLVFDPYLGFKHCFKMLLISPLSLPCNIIRKFNDW